MSGPQLAFALGALVNLAIFAGLLHWHGAIAEDQREEQGRLTDRDSDITLRELLAGQRMNDWHRSRGFEFDLLDETESKRRPSPVAATVRTREECA